ncbi:hypothetical protein QTN25_004559 [Entamoeba marina]
MNNNSLINIDEDFNFKEMIRKIKSLEQAAKKSSYKKINFEETDEIVKDKNENEYISYYDDMFRQQLNKVVNREAMIKEGDEQIQFLQKIIQSLYDAINSKDFTRIVSDVCNNSNEAIKDLNIIVDKMIDKKIENFHRTENEKTMVEESRNKSFNDEQEQRLKDNKEKIQQFEKDKEQRKKDFEKEIQRLMSRKFVIYGNEKEQFINASIRSLKMWSGKQYCKFIFDSEKNHEISTLYECVNNKQNLYFISFDDEKNVFGGYVDTTINTFDNWITDPHAFTFSLIRDGKVNNKRYHIGNDKEQHAFMILQNNNCLYKFGKDHDLYVSKCETSDSCCSTSSYDYSDEVDPLRKDGDKFKTKRIIVIQMKSELN